LQWEVGTVESIYVIIAEIECKYIDQLRNDLEKRIFPTVQIPKFKTFSRLILN